MLDHRGSECLSHSAIDSSKRPTNLYACLGVANRANPESRRKMIVERTTKAVLALARVASPDAGRESLSKPTHNEHHHKSGESERKKIVCHLQFKIVLCSQDWQKRARSIAHCLSICSRYDSQSPRSFHGTPAFYTHAIYEQD